MEGGDEVGATGVGLTGVDANGGGAKGGGVEVVVDGRVPNGWTEQQSRKVRRRSARIAQDRNEVESSVTPVRKKRRRGSPNRYAAISPTGQDDDDEDDEGDVGPPVQLESPPVSRRSPRHAKASRVSHEGLDEIDEAAVTLRRP